MCKEQRFLLCLINIYYCIWYMKLNFWFLIWKVNKTLLSNKRGEEKRMSCALYLYFLKIAIWRSKELQILLAGGLGAKALYSNSENEEFVNNIQIILLSVPSIICINLKVYNRKIKTRFYVRVFYLSANVSSTLPTSSGLRCVWHLCDVTI